jgi:hypothetical protein
MNNLTIRRLRPLLRFMPAAREAIVIAYCLAISPPVQQ